LLRPLPYENPEQLVVIQDIDRSTGNQLAPVAAANFLDWRTQNQVFSQMAILDSSPFNYVDASNPERLRGSSVSPNLMTLLGIKPILGRTFLPDEEKPGREMVVMLSYDLWQRRFAGNVIGRVVRLDSKQYTVIGVMPEQFDFPGQLRAPAELWIPMAVNEELRQARGHHSSIAIARLKMILSQGMLLVSIGLGLGLLLSLATGRLLASFLFGISATDAPTFVGVSLILALAALLACYLPAQKATRVDPMIALR
jgi:hypothetical protein